MSATLSLSITQGAQNIASNTTKITLKAYVISSESFNGNIEQTTGTYTIKNADHPSTVYASGTFSHTFAKNTTTKILEIANVDCLHNTDGSLKVQCDVLYRTGTSAGNLTGSISKKITTIPRASKINSVTNPLVLTNALNVTIYRYSSAFKHKIKVEAGSRNYETGFFTGTSHEISGGSGTVDYTWASVATQSKQFNAKVTLTTYTQDGTFVGDDSKTIKITIPNLSLFRPILTLGVSSIISPFTVSGVNYALMGISKLQIEAPTAEAQQGASISYYTINGKRVSSFPYTSGRLNASSNSFEIIAYDSRGYSAKETLTVPAYPYSNPQLTDISIFRCNSGGVKSDNGEYVSITATPVVAPVEVGNVSKNGINSFTYTVQQAGGGLSVSGNFDEATEIVALPGTSVDTHSFDVTIYLKDTVGRDITIKDTVSSANVAYNLREGGRGAAFGVYADEDECLKVDYDLKVRGTIYGGGLESVELLGNGISFDYPSGHILLYPTSGFKYFPALRMVCCDIAFKVIDNAISSAQYSNIFTISNAYKPRATTPIYSMRRTKNGANDAVIDNEISAYVTAGNIKINGNIPVNSDGENRVYLNGFWFV